MAEVERACPTQMLFMLRNETCFVVVQHRPWVQSLKVKEFLQVLHLKSEILVLHNFDFEFDTQNNRTFPVTLGVKSVVIPLTVFMIFVKTTK